MRKAFTRVVHARKKVAAEPAAGLHCPALCRTFWFADYRIDGEPLWLIAVGRSERCDICLPDPTVSQSHAVLKLERDGYTVKDGGSTNGVFIDGAGAIARTLITVGMELHLGNVLLVGVNKDGRAPLRGFSIASCRRDAVRIYGNPSEASRRVADGYSREFFRKSLAKKGAK
jgi:hypothetical protein